MKARRMLVADIGGTFSRFAHFRLEKREDALHLGLLPESRLKIPTASAQSFSGLLEQLRHTKSPGGYTLLPAGAAAEYELACAVMAVPGPVMDGECIAPNIPWPLRRADIEQLLDAPASLLNDFAAQGRACLFPDTLGLHTVLPGRARAAHPAAILGAGTGLGKALILPQGGTNEPADARIEAGQQHPPAPEIVLPPASLSSQGLQMLEKRVMPSEGGHSAFPFRGEEEAVYEAFMRKISGRKEVIGDMAVTGYGLSALYAFFAGENTLRNPPEITPLLKNMPQPLEWFARLYGRACRNFVLETLALGGVYLSGGMLSHVPGLLHHPAFEAEFRSSETQGHMLAEVPVRWVSNQDAGLWGAAVYGLRLAV